MVEFRFLSESMADLVKSYRERRNLRILAKAISRIIFKPVASIMTEQVATVSPEDSLYEAAKTMRQESLSCLVVVRDGKIRGILTESDFVRKVELSQDALSRKVKDVMSESVYCSSGDTTIFEANHSMASRKFRKLPIVKDDRLVGIVTQTDIVRALDRFATHSIIDTLNTVRVWQIMTRDMVILQQTEPVQKAKQTMAAMGISCILAGSASEVTGILTERDLVSEIVKDVSRLNRYRIQDVMKSPVVSIPPNLQLFEANHFMLEKNFRTLLIRKDDAPLGIITQTDIARAAYRFLDNLVRRLESKRLTGLGIDHIRE